PSADAAAADQSSQTEAILSVNDPIPRLIGNIVNRTHYLGQEIHDSRKAAFSASCRSAKFQGRTIAFGTPDKSQRIPACASQLEIRSPRRSVIRSPSESIPRSQPLLRSACRPNDGDGRRPPRRPVRIAPRRLRNQTGSLPPSLPAGASRD